MLRRLNLLRNAPIVVFLCLLYLVWPAKLVLREVEKNWGVRTDMPLNGQFAQIEKPSDPVRALWNHDFQKWAEAMVGRELPSRGTIIRAVNQVYFNLFSKSYMGGDNPLIIGDRKNIFTESYIIQYCDTLRNTPSEAEFAAWAARLDRTRAWLEGQGKTFVYFSSPSKASYFARDLPSGFGCEGAPKRPRYRRAMEALAATQIPMVDAAALILAKRGQFDVELFPIGGIHYNALGAAITANALLEAIGASRNVAIPPISEKHTITTARNVTPGNIDRDVTDLLNLLNPRLDYAVPELGWGGYPPGGPLPLNLTFVGGSFVSQPARLIGLYRLFASVEHFSYLRLARVSYPEETASEVGAEDYDRLFASDVIVLEENEETSMSTHGIAFLEEAERRQAADGAQ